MEEFYSNVQTIAPEAEKETFSPWEPEARVKRVDSSLPSVTCFVLLEDNPALCQCPSFDMDILGQKMYQYVARACPTPAICVKYSEGNNIVDLIRPYIKDTEYSLVLFSDTPLITKSNVLSILDFAKSRGLNVCKLSRGFVFKNEYIKRVDEIYAPSTYYFEEEEFLVASTLAKVQQIASTMKKRIINYHQNNGVYFKDPDSAYVEAGVSIGKGTIIEPFVLLGQKTVIGENAQIGAKSTILGSKIGNGVRVLEAFLQNATVKAGAVVAEGCHLYDCSVKENCFVGRNSTVQNASIGQGSTVGENCKINYLKCEKGVKIGNFVQISGKQTDAVLLADGERVESGSNIFYGIGE